MRKSLIYLCTCTRLFNAWEIYHKYFRQIHTYDITSIDVVFPCRWPYSKSTNFFLFSFHLYYTFFYFFFSFDWIDDKSFVLITLESQHAYFQFHFNALRIIKNHSYHSFFFFFQSIISCIEKSFCFSLIYNKLMKIYR